MSKQNTKKLGYVIDTNVLCVASGMADHVENTCIINSVKFLQKTKTDAHIVYLDEAGEILSEYKNKNKPLGRNGKIGDQFLLYLIQNMGNKNLVKQVKIIKNEENYLDFPLDEDLK
jgi:hypothetical protein